MIAFGLRMSVFKIKGYEAHRAISQSGGHEIGFARTPAHLQGGKGDCCTIIHVNERVNAQTQTGVAN